MKKINTMLLAILLMIAPCLAKAGELSDEDKSYFKEITIEWEWAFGPHETWDYRTKGLFCQLYRNYPNAEYEANEATLPTIPPADAVPCEEAIDTAIAFLMEYDPAVFTDRYLQSLQIGTSYIDLPYTQDDRGVVSHLFWFIQFFECINGKEYLMRCNCYIDAKTGKVFRLNLNINGKDENDWSDYKTIEIQ